MLNHIENEDRQPCQLSGAISIPFHVEETPCATLESPFVIMDVFRG